jgi:predicted HicB family RNase H-like nuclease
MGKTQLNIRMPESMHDDVAQHADALDLNVSEYVREALRQKMQNEL